MRRIASLLGLGLGLTLAACQLDLPSGSSGAGTDATGTTGTGGAAAHPCDNKNSCDTCKSCSLEVQCAKLATACTNDSSCYAIDTCFFNCGSDAQCKEQCYLLGPNGEALYRAFRACVFCDACPSDCAGFMVCQ